jgi:hypothetical protein
MSDGAAASDGDLVAYNFEAIKEYCKVQKRIAFNDLRKEFHAVATGILERSAFACPTYALLSAT